LAWPSGPWASHKQPQSGSVVLPRYGRYRVVGLPRSHLGLGLLPGWPAWFFRPSRTVKFVESLCSPHGLSPSSGVAAHPRQLVRTSLSLLRFVECASLPVSLQPSAPSVQAHLRTAGANRRSCSVLVVSHHLDGFLRLQLCGLIASRYQLEVRRFSGVPALRLPKQVGGASRTPSQATLLTPFGVFPSPVAVPRHHLRLPGLRRNASLAALDVHQRPLPS